MGAGGLTKPTRVSVGAALREGARGGHVGVVKVLLGYAGREEGKSLEGDEKGRDRTALMIAAEKGHVEIVKALLDANVAAMDAMDGTGRTALAHAAANGRFDVVQVLLGRGAAANVLDWRGDGPATHALRGGYPQLAELIEGH